MRQQRHIVYATNSIAVLTGNTRLNPGDQDYQALQCATQAKLNSALQPGT